MKHKLLSCLLGACLMAAIAGCNKEATPSSVTSSEAVETETSEVNENRTYQLNYSNGPWDARENHTVYLENEYELFDQAFLDSIDGKETETKDVYFFGDQIQLAIYVGDPAFSPDAHSYVIGEYGYSKDDTEYQYGILVGWSSETIEGGEYITDGGNKLYKLTAEEYNNIKEKAYQLAVKE